MPSSNPTAILKLLNSRVNRRGNQERQEDGHKIPAKFLLNSSFLGECGDLGSMFSPSQFSYKAGKGDWGPTLPS